MAKHTLEVSENSVKFVIFDILKWIAKITSLRELLLD